MRKTSGLEELGHILRQRTRTLHEERASVNLRLQKETAKSSLALSEFYFEVEFLRVPVYVYTGGEIRTINLESEFWARKKHDEISEIYINNLY